MHAADRLEDESGRLTALRRYHVLDTAEEPPFETIVDLVEQVLAVPICAVTLIDSQRQWFKARRGIGMAETPRDFSFCAHAIRDYGPMLVPDATQDPRFAQNPLVTAEPRIRSYAGVPLTTPDGYNVGSLCAIDVRPRQFANKEVAILSNFARLIVDALELREIASVDPLTGVMSRRTWMEVANKEVARTRRHGGTLSLVALDIDRFKRINDTHGHPAGDRVLRAVASAIGDMLRVSDSLGRLGGEEFAILLPETPTLAARNLAERCRVAVEGLRTPVEDGTIAATSSFGIATFRPGIDTLDSWLQRADRALYQAKNEGRNRCVLAEVPADPAAETER
jgi:diguanylate cyclase (GGDEF)-like protein